MTSRSKGGQEFCDVSTKALVIQRVTIAGRGVNNYPKLRDVIYGQPHNDVAFKTYFFLFLFL